MKRLIGIILSVIIVISYIVPISVEAKVIEPEIVKTESWTTSYYIDDDMDTLYPYIQCEADIYNDGTIKLYMWNTHEWDGFATVEHHVQLSCTTLSTPISTCDIPYSIRFETEIPYDVNDFMSWKRPNHNNGDMIRCISVDFPSCDISFFDNRYSCKRDYLSQHHGWIDVTNATKGASSFGGTCSESYKFAVYDSNFDGGYPYTGYLYFDCIDTYLPNLISSDSRNKKPIYILTPNEDPTGVYNFRLYGHDITITPELLSGSIIAEPELTEQEKYIKQLEEENAKLKASITNTNLFGDINGDNLVDVADAQMILNYYVYTLANSNAESLEEWISKQ